METKKYFVYVLKSENFDRFYIGQTDNIERRLKQHNKGKVLSTIAYVPFKLVLKEEFSSRCDAVAREKELKSTNGRRYIKSILILE
jgi:putative endonuclease